MMTVSLLVSKLLTSFPEGVGSVSAPWKKIAYVSMVKNWMMKVKHFIGFALPGVSL
jgi:hypothetical protein